MKIDIAIERRLLAPLPHAEALGLLDDTEALLRRFPKLRKLTRIDAHSFQTDMATMGSRIAKIAHDASFAARYSTDRSAGALRWEPIPGRGNAQLAGQLRLLPQGAQTELHCSVRGRLDDVPVPLLYRPVAGAFIEAKFRDLVDRFLAALAARSGA